VPARTCNPVTQAELVRDWRRALDAFGAALADEGEERYFSPAELRELERHLAAERRWLAHFAAIRNFP
jgi:transposase-like protein